MTTEKEFFTDALPAEFLDRVYRCVPASLHTSLHQAWEADRPWCLRVNELKISVGEVLADFRRHGIPFRQVPWFPAALVTAPDPETIPVLDAMIGEGRLYRQGLASLLAPVVLDPRPGEQVLDMCAAPGSKTTQMAAMMRNDGRIVAVEAVRKRFYRLKHIVRLLDAGIITCVLKDARRFRAAEILFDRILVDAPCSAEGRFRRDDPSTFRYWRRQKIKEMVHKQRGLLRHAERLLRPGGVMVYATCTLAPEENEGVVSWLLRRVGDRLRLVPPVERDVPSYPALRTWENREFDPRVKDCLRILPGREWEGFFLAKFVKSPDVC